MPIALKGGAGKPAPYPTPLGAFIAFQKIGDKKKMPEKNNAPTQYDAVLADLYAKRDEIESAINTILSSGFRSVSSAFRCRQWRRADYTRRSDPV